jgi:starvation-inducible DNA-binding protein
MFPTRNDLPESTRTAMVALLNARLADAIDLYHQIKQAHWNVKGPNFIALHELFDEIASGVLEHVDTIAERATAIGGVAQGTIQAVGKNTSLSPYSLKLSAGRDHLTAVADALAAFGKSARAAIEDADKAGDADTADLFTQVSRDVDQRLWFIEAHLQGDK